MKKLVLILMIAITAISKGQSPSLEQVINEGLAAIDSAKTIADMQAIVNKFQRITIAEPDRWELFYHLAYAQTIMSFFESNDDAKDKILDQSEVSLNKALELNGDKSELHALQGYIYQGRIQVSPMRGMTYSQKAGNIIEKAIEENPENPRAHFLLAQNIYYTPKIFGGGSKHALPKYQVAKEKFEKENGKNVIGPQWGKRENLEMIKKCSFE